jgi:hypothetical protein
MKRIFLLVALLASCAYPSGSCPDPAVAPVKKFGASSTLTGNQGTWVTTGFPTITAPSTTYIVFSTTSQGDTVRGRYPGLERVALRARFDQATTILYQTLAAAPATTWRTLNGSGSGDSLAAGTDYAVDFLVLGPDVRLEVVTGGTPPTTQEISTRLSNDRALGMFQ